MLPELEPETFSYPTNFSRHDDASLDPSSPSPPPAPSRPPSPPISQNLKKRLTVVCLTRRAPLRALAAKPESNSGALGGLSANKSRQKFCIILFKFDFSDFNPSLEL
eukprot:3345087-Pyramimonas_sp.AAC.1